MNTPTDPLPFFETAFWRVSLHRNQTYLGRSVVVLKRPCGTLGDVREEEMSDFLSLVRKVERGYRVSLGATMFNWSCSMNFAYRNTPPDPQVHWHVQPRYDHSVSFDGAMYNDPNFGDRALSTNTPIPDEAMAALEIALKSALSND